MTFIDLCQRPAEVELMEITLSPQVTHKPPAPQPITPPVPLNDNKVPIIDTNGYMIFSHER